MFLIAKIPELGSGAPKWGTPEKEGRLYISAPLKTLPVKDIDVHQIRAI